MAGNKRQTLEGWIEQAFSDATDIGKPLTGLSLVHCTGFANEKEIHSARGIGSKQFAAKQWADLFMGRAQSYSQDIEGKQTFKLLAFYGDSNESQGEHPFTIAGETGEYSNDVTSEKPDKQGILGQHMNFTTQMFTAVNKRQAEIDTVHKGMLGMLAEENTKLRIENLDALRIIKDLMLQRTQEEHKMKMEALTFERQSQERTQWLRLLPAITNSLTGREVFPVASSDTAIIEMVAENIKQEDLMKLMEIVPPQLQGILAQRFTQLLKEKEAIKKEAETAIVKVSATPEDNAAGD